MVTTLPSHEVKPGTSTAQTFSGGDAMDARADSGAALPGTPVSNSSLPGSNSSPTAGTVLNNGPGLLTSKGDGSSSSSSSNSGSGSVGGSSVPATSSTVIIQASASTGPTGATRPIGPTVTVLRPAAMHTTPPTGTTIGAPALAVNGSNMNAVLNVAQQAPTAPPAPATAAGVTLTLTPQTPGQALAPAPAPPGAPLGTTTIKPEPAKSIIHSAAGQSVVGHLHVSPGAAKGAVQLQQQQGVVRSLVAQTPSPAGVRAIAPQQVLAPRIPQSSPGQPSIQNIQLPPGMVLVRSETGQLLMIPQQVLAQMQAQMQATRTATPVSTTPGQITSAQTPGAPIMSRPFAPVIRQGSPTTSSPATTTLQRPPAQLPSVGSVLTVQPGTAPRVATPATGTSITLPTETMENVKKCKNFLSTLIKLATSAKQSSQTAANVKELVKNLLEGRIEAEDFTSRLYKELNSSPQPYLVPFLKRSLPALRQLTPDSLAFIQQSQGLPVRPAATVALASPTLVNPVTAASVATTVPVATAAAPAATGTATIAAGTATATTSSVVSAATAATTAPRTLIQPAHNKTTQSASLVLQSQQQGTIVKTPQVALTTTPMVALRGQPPSRIVVGQPHMQVKPLQTVSMKPGAVSGPRLASSPATLLAAQKSKLKDAAGGTFRDDDDINDVASMAGVNLSEESARILATNSDVVGAVTRSCKDEAFLSTALLQRRILDIGKRFGVTDLAPEVVNLVSHAAQQRLQNLLEKVSVIAQQKNMTYKEDGRYEQVTDVRAQLKFFEQLDQMEKQKKEEQEREILMKAAKSRSRQEDPEQLRLKQKAKEMQQQELAQIRQREANLTALAAIGPRKKRKVDSPALGTDAEGSGSSANATAGLSGGVSRQFARQRITRVNLRDLLFCLENERESSRSQLLYRALLK
ncbi:transcription initiation factor TFIID subunit 4 [Astyanax mexicanus]|uniref:transcription initiation factor TFIID subunit 4 n=1 Tax=Astyanax mexicanus TaxID=7994 RepID=UPI0020CB2D96|nr:transcription initiation factor TFIID subunit 4 [Astyanax mexicanus]